MKISLLEAQKEIGVGKTKLFSLFKELGIERTKQGNKSFLTLDQVNEIKDFINSPEQSEPSERKEQTKKEALESDFQQKRIEQLEAELAVEREENKSLTREVGLWQGRAKTLEEQNTKLLELSPPEEEKQEIEEAEIIEEPKPKKKGWFSFFR